MDSNQRSNKTASPGFIKILGVFGACCLFVAPLMMLFFGFSTREVVCVRAPTSQMPDCEVNHIRLFGLLNYRERAVTVSSVGHRAVSSMRTPGIRVFGQQTILNSSNGIVLIPLPMNKKGNAWDVELFDKMRQFLDTPAQVKLEMRCNEDIIVGWAGVIILALLLWSHIVWFIGTINARQKIQ